MGKTGIEIGEFMKLAKDKVKLEKKVENIRAIPEIESKSVEFAFSDLNETLHRSSVWQTISFARIERSI